MPNSITEVKNSKKPFIHVSARVSESKSHAASNRRGFKRSLARHYIHIFRSSKRNRLLHQHVLRKLTFEESVSCDREERRLHQSLAENKGLEPHRRIQHHGVSELLRVPLQEIPQLGGHRSRGELLTCTNLYRDSSRLLPALTG